MRIANNSFYADSASFRGATRSLEIRKLEDTSGSVLKKIPFSGDVSSTLT